jgi:cobalt-zinc-cadmium efflux system outer membrane protein
LIIFCLTVFISTLFAEETKRVDSQKSSSLSDVSDQTVYTLESSIKRVLEVSPVIHAAAAEVAARNGDLSQAGAWPNPDVEVSGSNKLGIDDTTGGVDLTQVAVNQPIPLGRLSRQRKQAKAQLKMAEANLHYQQLLQEAEAAKQFHNLQLTTAKFHEAEEQLKFAEHYQKNKNNQKNDPLVRYLTPLEQKRLDIISAEANQALANTKGEYAEALSNFKALLQLPHDVPVEAVPLKSAELPESLEVLSELQEKNHPALKMAQYQVEAGHAGIALAKNELFQDPTFKLFGERDYLNDKRANFYGAGVTLQLPLWDRKNGSITKAKAEASKVEYDLQALKQQLKARLEQNRLHVGLLIEQAEHYQADILLPAKEMLELTQKGFLSGEVNVLSLVDANNTYFDATKRYQELLYGAWIELTELHLSSGQSWVVTNNNLNGDKA